LIGQALTTGVAFAVAFAEVLAVAAALGLFISVGLIVVFSGVTFPVVGVAILFVIDVVAFLVAGAGAFAGGLVFLGAAGALGVGWA
jgi:hypothetical protein